MTFCTITQESGHGGIARVSSLLWRVIESRYSGACELLTVTQPGRDVSFKGKLFFSGRVMGRQLFHHCDKLFFDHLGIARVQRLVPRSARLPYGIFLHSIEAWKPLRGSRLKAVREAKLRVANSSYTAARVAAANPDIGPIEVCHLALDPDQWKDCADSRSPVLNQIQPNSVLIVGRMIGSERHKGHEQLIQAWPQVKREIPNAQLVIVGRGDDVTRLRKLAEHHGVGGEVLFTGPVSDATLQAIYQSVALFAMPSRGEGFGIVYLEAMRHRLPCIASSQDAAREIVINGETGYLVDQEDIRSLATRLVQLLADPPLRRRLGCNGLQRLKTHFSFEAFRSRICDLLAQLDI